MNKAQSKLNYDTHTQPDNRVRGKKRLDLILQGLDAGKSRRKIAAELGVDEGTVRRGIKILLLPGSCLTAIENGATAEMYLRNERHHAAENAKRLQLAQEKRAAETSRAQRLSEERLSGCHSNALARLLLRCLYGEPLAESYIEQLLAIVEPANERIGDRLATPLRNASRTLVLCGWNNDPGYMPEKLEYLASVLLEALPLITPEWAIRCLAIRKAVRGIENPRQCPPELRN